MKDEFSIREEIRVILDEYLCDSDIDPNEVYKLVECDELMLSMITLSIYTAISEKLKEKNIENEKVEANINQMKTFVFESLTDRGII
jgi:hypothetical protein